LPSKPPKRDTNTLPVYGGLKVQRAAAKKSGVGIVGLIAFDSIVCLSFRPIFGDLDMSFFRHLHKSLNVLYVH